MQNFPSDYVVKKGQIMKLSKYMKAGRGIEELDLWNKAVKGCVFEDFFITTSCTI